MYNQYMEGEEGRGGENQCTLSTDGLHLNLGKAFQDCCWLFTLSLFKHQLHPSQTY